MRRTILVSLILPVFILSSTSLAAFSRVGAGLGITAVQAQDEYVYCGYIPREIWGVAWVSGLEEFRFDPATVSNRGLVVVIGNHDGTRVKVYTLPDGRLVEDTTLDKLHRVTAILRNGTFFKVSASQVATVVVMAGKGMERGESDANIYFTAIDGRYVGKEFIFIAVQAKTGGLPYRVYALEDSDIMITDANNTKVQEFKLSANEYKVLSFQSLETYRLTSTGNVILKSGVLGTCFYPAVEGGFVGKLFYGSSGPDEAWPSWAPPQFVMTGLAASRITVIDEELKRKYGGFDLAAGGNMSVQLKLSHMVVESEQPIILLMQGSGVGFLGLKAGQEAYVDIPTNEPYQGEIPHLSMAFKGEAYLFAYTETTVTIDDVTIRLSADQIEPLTPGYHRISATENVLIQLVNWPAQVYSPLTHSETRLADLAACIPSVQAAGLPNIGLKVKPVLGAELPWTYIIIVIALVLVLAVLSLPRRRRKS